jgi:N utilization substance protein B
MRLARERTLQALYQLDILSRGSLASVPAPSVGEAVLSVSDADVDTPLQQDFIREIAEGVVREAGALDGVIQEVSPKWRMERMGLIDRAILRFGVYELKHRPDTGLEVVINEAVILARKYGGDDSPRFVNGLLQEVAKKLNLARRSL